MAIIFGGKSSYLVKKRAVELVLFVIIVSLLLALPRIELFLPRQGIYTLLALVLLVLLGEKATDYIVRRYCRVDNGIYGEEQIARELRKLPDDFAVFHGLKISEHQDIDFAVVGPTGFYALEVKSHKGRIGFDGHRLTRNGRALEKDFLSEATREALGLRDLVRATAKIEAFVEPVIVFSSQYAGVSFGAEKIRGCYVIQKSWLVGLLRNGEAATAAPREIIIAAAKALSALVKDKRQEEKLSKLGQRYKMTKYDR